MILAVAAVLSIIYVGKLILVVVLISILLSFVLAPVVDLLVQFSSSTCLWAPLSQWLSLVGGLGAASYAFLQPRARLHAGTPAVQGQNSGHGAVKIREQAEQIEQHH